eukprot:m.21822 g.21822  ORF g.21822 m.21822 type:complete len:2077 (-) comp13566_c0_seq1:50-6280(-)
MLFAAMLVLLVTLVAPAAAVCGMTTLAEGTRFATVQPLTCSTQDQGVCDVECILGWTSIKDGFHVSNHTFPAKCEGAAWDTQAELCVRTSCSRSTLEDLIADTLGSPNSTTTGPNSNGIKIAIALQSVYEFGFVYQGLACEDGFEPIGEIRYPKCESENTWSGGRISCRPTLCPALVVLNAATDADVENRVTHVRLDNTDGLSPQPSGALCPMSSCEDVAIVGNSTVFNVAGFFTAEGTSTPIFFDVNEQISINGRFCPVFGTCENIAQNEMPSVEGFFVHIVGDKHLQYLAAGTASPAVGLFCTIKPSVHYDSATSRINETIIAITDVDAYLGIEECRTTFGGVCTTTCMAGYEQIQTHFECRSDGQWFPSLATMSCGCPYLAPADVDPFADTSLNNTYKLGPDQHSSTVGCQPTADVSNSNCLPACAEGFSQDGSIQCNMVTGQWVNNFRCIPQLEFRVAPQQYFQGPTLVGSSDTLSYFNVNTSSSVASLVDGSMYFESAEIEDDSEVYFRVINKGSSINRPMYNLVLSTKNYSPVQISSNQSLQQAIDFKNLAVSQSLASSIDPFVATGGSGYYSLHDVGLDKSLPTKTTSVTNSELQISGSLTTGAGLIHHLHVVAVDREYATHAKAELTFSGSNTLRESIKSNYPFSLSSVEGQQVTVFKVTERGEFKATVEASSKANVVPECVLLPSNFGPVVSTFSNNNSDTFRLPNGLNISDDCVISGVLDTGVTTRTQYRFVVKINVQDEFLRVFIALDVFPPVQVDLDGGNVLQVITLGQETEYRQQIKISGGQEPYDIPPKTIILPPGLQLQYKYEIVGTPTRPTTNKLAGGSLKNVNESFEFPTVTTYGLAVKDAYPSSKFLVAETNYVIGLEDCLDNSNGPDGIGCNESAAGVQCIDNNRFDKNFSCDCVDSGYTGDTCEIPPPIVLEIQDNTPESPVVTIVIVLVFVLLLVAAVAYVIYQRHLLNVPFDFEAERQKLINEGNIMIKTELTKRVPQEIKRSRVITLEKLGSGAFGDVCKGVYTPEEPGEKEFNVAIKVLKADCAREDREELMKEAMVTCQFVHVNVVGMVGVVTKGAPEMLILTICEKGALNDLLKKKVVDKVTKGKYCLAICRGMEYLASLGFVHRDLAARNVLVDNNDDCKVADFGLSRDTEDQEYYVAKAGKVPIRWTSVEALVKRKFGQPSDVWAFAIVGIEIWTDAVTPYKGWMNAMVMEQVLDGFVHPCPPLCPTNYYELAIAPALRFKPKTRPMFSQMVKALNVYIDNDNAWLRDECGTSGNVTVEVPLTYGMEEDGDKVSQRYKDVTPTPAAIEPPEPPPPDRPSKGDKSVKKDKKNGKSIKKGAKSKKNKAAPPPSNASAPQNGAAKIATNPNKIKVPLLSRDEVYAVTGGRLDADTIATIAKEKAAIPFHHGRIMLGDAENRLNLFDSGMGQVLRTGEARYLTWDGFSERSIHLSAIVDDVYTHVTLVYGQDHKWKVDGKGDALSMKLSLAINKVAEPLCPFMAKVDCPLDKRLSIHGTSPHFGVAWWTDNKLATVVKANIVNGGEGTYALWQSLVDVDLLVLCVFDGGVAVEHEVDWISTDRTWCFLNEPYDSIEEMLDTLSVDAYIPSVSGRMLKLMQPAEGCVTLNSERALLWAWGGDMNRKMIQDLIKLSSVGDFLFRPSSKEGQVVLSINDHGECVHYPVTFDQTSEKWAFAAKTFLTLRQLIGFLEEEPVKSSRGQPDYLLGAPALGGTVHDVEHLAFGVNDDPSPHLHTDDASSSNNSNGLTEDDEYDVVENDDAPPPRPPAKKFAPPAMGFNDANANSDDDGDAYELPTSQQNSPPMRAKPDLEADLPGFDDDAYALPTEEEAPPIVKKTTLRVKPPVAPERRSLKKVNRSTSDEDEYELPVKKNAKPEKTQFGFGDNSMVLNTTSLNPSFMETNIDAAQNDETYEDVDKGHTSISLGTGGDGDEMYEDADDVPVTNTRTITLNIDITDKIGAALNSIGANRPKFFTKIADTGVIGMSGRINVGDEVISVNGVALTPMSKEEAVQMLKKKGKVTFEVRENREGYQDLYDARQKKKRTNSVKLLA